MPIQKNKKTGWDLLCFTHLTELYGFMRGFLFCNNETFVDFGIFFLLVKRKRTCGKRKLHTFAANSHIIVNQLRIYIENHSYLCSNFIFFKAKVGLSVFFLSPFYFWDYKGS